jgi:hypothetical protein
MLEQIICSFVSDGVFQRSIMVYDEGLCNYAHPNSIRAVGAQHIRLFL